MAEFLDMTPDDRSSDLDAMPLANPSCTVMLIAIMKLKGFGRRTALEIVNRILAESCAETYVEALTSSVERLYPARTSADAISDAWHRSAEELARTNASGIRVVAFHDRDFPMRLRRIPDPPAILYVRGNLAAMSTTKSLAVIGTQEPTPYGKIVAKKSARSAVENGFSIVSGLARGCDTYAHVGCVEASGIGVAVLGAGLDRLYPASNQDLADKILENSGCLVSEYALGTKPTKWTFAERDRIQSGLSDGILVIETDVVGGTMHTVRYARQQKRPLACLIHPEKYRHAPKTKGNQKLRRDGWATPVSDRNTLYNFLDFVSYAKTDNPMDIFGYDNI